MHLSWSKLDHRKVHTLPYSTSVSGASITMKVKHGSSLRIEWLCRIVSSEWWHISRVLDGTEFEIMYLDYLNTNQYQIGVIVGKGDPFEKYRNRKFKERYCLDKETVCWLVHEMDERLEFPTNRNNLISPINRVLTALQWHLICCYYYFFL